VLSRIFSTILIWGIVGGSLYYGGVHAAVILITLLATFTLHEFYSLTEKAGFKPFRGLGLAFCVLMMAAPYYVSEYLADGEEFVGLVPGLLAIAVVFFSAGILSARDNTNRVETLVTSMMGLLYVPFMLHYLVRLMMIYAEPSSGLVLALWVVAVSKFCDVGALLTGLAFGRHKMAPNISPKKTWEGAIGGVLVSAGLGATIAYYAESYLPEMLNPVMAALIGATLAIVTIISDLIESVMKRRADIKDTGKLIPGIGGAFDLTDSLILTAPVAYYIFSFLA
jgi:phosphatidate cytidylyltransferase